MDSKLPKVFYLANRSNTNIRYRLHMRVNMSMYGWMIAFGRHEVTRPKVTQACRLLVAAPAKVKINLISYYDKESSLRTFPWMPLRGACWHLRSSQSFTSNAHQVSLLVAPPLSGHATTPMVLSIDWPFPSRMPKVINHRLLVHYYDESARHKLITMTKSIPTKGIW
jgi:hypothetical protein